MSSQTIVSHSQLFKSLPNYSQSKRKLMDKIAIFKGFHRELQEETFTYKNQAEQNRGRQDLLAVGE